MKLISIRLLFAAVIILGLIFGVAFIQEYFGWEEMNSIYAKVPTIIAFVLNIAGVIYALKERKKDKNFAIAALIAHLFILVIIHPILLFGVFFID